MFNTVKVRQGALVCHVDGSGKVEYEICMAIPHNMILSDKVKDNANIVTRGNNVYIKKHFGAKRKDAIKFKFNIQLAVTEYKLAMLQLRKESLLINKRSIQ